MEANELQGTEIIKLKYCLYAYILYRSKVDNKK